MGGVSFGGFLHRVTGPVSVRALIGPLRYGHVRTFTVRVIHRPHSTFPVFTEYLSAIRKARRR
jgi:hypothetical protein